MVFFCLEPESTFSILDILQLLIKLYTTVEASDEKILSSEKEPDVGSRRDFISPETTKKRPAPPD